MLKSGYLWIVVQYVLISQINNIQLTICISEKLENKSKYMLQQAAARRSGMDQTPLRRRLV